MYELLSALDERAHVLDLGCGKGSFRYADFRCRITALDSTFADAAPATLQRHGDRVSVLVGEGHQLPLASASIDMVVANHVFEHVADPRRVAGEIGRVLKPNGVLFASIPDGFSFADGLYRWWTAGGGHIQRYTFSAFQDVVESGTGLSLLSAHRLYSSFSFLNPNAEAAPHIGPRSQSLKYLPRAARVGALAGINLLSRAADAALRTRLSLYGWAFCFGKPEAVLPAVHTEEQINVCAFCGYGHSAGWLKHTGRVERKFLLRTFTCVSCGCRNPYFGPAMVERVTAGGMFDEEETIAQPPPAPATALPKPSHEGGPHIGRIVSAFESLAAFAPGSLMAIEGEQLASEREESPGPWPLELGGVRVFVNDLPVPLASVSPSRIVAQLPFYAPRGKVTITIRSKDAVIATCPSSLLLVAPILLTDENAAEGLGKFFHHAGGQPVTRENPAALGEFITFRATGLGMVAPPAEAGQPAKAEPLSITLRRCIARIGNRDVQVEYSGLAPGTIGFYQVDFRVPRGLAAGDNPFLLKVGAYRSNTVLLPVRR